MDIVFIVDESGSICDNDDTFEVSTGLCDNWLFVRKFLEEFVANDLLDISPDGTHVGMVTFRDDVTIDWGLDRYTNKADLLAAITTLPYQPFGRTFTADALNVTQYGVSRLIFYSNIKANHLFSTV